MVVSDWECRFSFHIILAAPIPPMQCISVVNISIQDEELRRKEKKTADISGFERTLMTEVIIVITCLACESS